LPSSFGGERIFVCIKFGSRWPSPKAKTIIKRAWENKKVSANTLHTFLSAKNLLKKTANARDQTYTKEQFVKLIKTNKAITGHSSDAMFSRYNKINRDDIDEAVDELEFS
jgi:hypothetical protein